MTISLGMTIFFTYQNYQLKQKIRLGQLDAKRTPLPTVSPTIQPSFPPLTIHSLYPSSTFSEGIYKDHTYDFQVTIPAGWLVRPTGGSRDNKIYPGDTLQLFNYDSNDERLVHPKQGLSAEVQNPIKVEVFISTDENKTLEEIKNQRIDEATNPESERAYDPGLKTEDLLLNGRSAIKFIPGLRHEGEWFTESIVCLNDKGNKFWIVFYARDGIEPNREIFDEILSSFKFLD